VFERRRARIVLATLMLASLVLITIDERAGAEGTLGRVRDGVATVFEPVQDGLAIVLRPLGGFFSGVTDLFHIRSDNARMKAELDVLRDRRRSLEDLARENESLREVLGMRDKLAAGNDRFRFLTAEVIALAPSNFEWTITLDAGAADGVQLGMTVINGDGIVGRVIQVGPNASRVLLAIDRNFSAAVRVSRTRQHAYAQGGGTEPMRLNLLDPDSDVRQGDEVVTSTYSNAVFPDGIPLGAVDTVGVRTGLLGRDVLVRPYVDFTRLDFVLVILQAPPPQPLLLPAPGEPATPGSGPRPSPSPKSTPRPPA
jgi:rod shape-determining protein MreC